MSRTRRSIQSLGRTLRGSAEGCLLDCTSVPLPTGPRPIGIQQMLSTLRMLSTDHDNQRRARVNKILYRAKQRGFLELDLLIGTWAEKNTALLPEAELDAMEELLDEENPDLWKWVTSQVDAPSHVASNPVFLKLKEQVDGEMASRREERTAAAKGSEWVRGWDDLWKNRLQEKSTKGEEG